MTRTERNTYPAAVSKDRHSRTGMTKSSESSRKGGAGPHNWGSFSEEEALEYQGGIDAQLETAMFDDGNDDNADDNESKADADNDNDADTTGRSPSDSTGSLDRSNQPPRRMSQVSDEDRAQALRYREGGLKQNGVDLASIARTSYGVATSPTNASILSTSPLRSKPGFSQQQ